MSKGAVKKTTTLFNSFAYALDNTRHRFGSGLARVKVFTHPHRDTEVEKE